MRLTINGEQRDLPDTVRSVGDLVAHLGLAPGSADSRPAPGLGGAFAVEVNGALAPRRRFAEHVLADGDRVEIVTLVGGG